MKCYNLFLQSQNLSASRSNLNPNTNIFSPSAPNPVPLISPLIISTFVERVILSDPMVIDTFNQFKSQFSSATTLDFYTDGSVIDLTLPTCRMGLRWIQTNETNPVVEFQAAVTSNPSSSKAKSLAILTALITALLNCQVKIFTDSQNSITTYQKVSSLTKY